MVAAVPNRKKTFVLLSIVAIMIVLPMFGKLINLAVDYLWFKELRLTTIFSTSIYARIICAAIAGSIAFAVVYANIMLARRISSRSNSYESLDGLSLVRFFQMVPIEKIALLIGSLLLSAFIAMTAAGYWEMYLKFRSAVLFGVTDPLFGKDIAFYVFQLPLLRPVYFVSMAIVVFSCIGAGLVYVIHRNIGFDGRRLIIPSGIRAHILALIGLLVCSLYFYFQFKMYAMVNAPNTVANGAGYAQIKTAIPLLGIMRFVSVLAGLGIWLSIAGKSYKLFIASVLVFVSGGIITFGASQIVQKFVVGPDELAKETPYISWSIASTQKAFGLDKMESRHFIPAADLTADLLRKNEATIGNIRLWEYAPLLTTYSQLQEIRTYYEFLDVDNDRYTIDGKYRQVMLSPRELVPSSLPSRMWINEHLTYTHGYGLCLGVVNSVTSEGLPDFLVKNIPPVSTSNVTVTRPEIYYGEAQAGYAIVNTGAKEFDYPSGNDNIYTVYNGGGGIRIGGLARKLLFTLHLRELKILLRADITADSKLLLNRQILARVQKAVPFLSYDSDPYMIIADDGRLLWIVDGYTTTNAYPYSTQVGSFGNYIRNSVKAVVDAYSGSITLYAWDAADPILKTYAKVFPGVFRPVAEMPSDVRSHVRYPQTLFSVQAHVYAVYHMTDPQVFYNKEDVWRIPESFSSGTSEPMKPYYTIMKLAEVGEKEEFILMVPFCPSKKENMIAWMAARCDEPNSGKLLVFDFPKQKLVYGPSQIESRINQDPEISKQLTLWNQGGSRVIMGSLLVIPVEQSLIYVQPLYLTSESGGVPELKRVIAAYENSIALEETLEKSLLRIFGNTSSAEAPAQFTVATPGVSTAPETNLKNLVEEANRQFKIAQTEQMRGNWAGYGEALKKMENLLAEMVKKAK